MNCCESHYDTIVAYNGKNCPFCVAVEELENANQEIENLNESIRESDRE